MSHSSHLKYMIIAGAVALAGGWAFGVPLGRALPYAILLACPLMMMIMMRGMDHGGHGAGGHGAAGTDDSGHRHEDSPPTGDIDVPEPMETTARIGRIDEKYRR